MLTSIVHFLDEVFVRGLIQFASRLKFCLCVFLAPQRTIETAQTPMHVYLVRLLLLGELQFPQRIVSMACVRINDAKIEIC